MVDGNLARAAVMNATGQTAPGDVGSTLVLEDIDDADVRLTWNAAPGAAVYHVYRSSAPDFGFEQIGQPTGLLHDDTGAQTAPENWYYRVVAADACGNESAD
jgi:hypothetical protein